jgi:CDK inhibitor PHO81
MAFICRKRRRYLKLSPFLQLEADCLQFSLRLKTLQDKKRVIQARLAANSRLSASFATLVEGFQQFDNDLNKLQVRPMLNLNDAQRLTQRSNLWV